MFSGEILHSLISKETSIMDKYHTIKTIATNMSLVRLVSYVPEDKKPQIQSIPPSSCIKKEKKNPN